MVRLFLLLGTHRTQALPFGPHRFAGFLDVEMGEPLDHHPLLLEYGSILAQLSLESKIGKDLRASVTDTCEGLLELQVSCFHQVGDHSSAAAGHPSVAVDKHSATTLDGVVDEGHG